MSRGDGKPKSKRHLNIGDDQYEILLALAKASEDGTPSISSIVRKAIQDYIDRRFERSPALRDQIAKQMGAGKLVSIKGGRSNSEKGGAH
jgi:hypothetical protein